ncbi:MAG TPA: polysaccharide biosynthesis tyrosine autokinase [Candidatus Sulfotelmatobacter sp.]|nr:polysaccharide biosynthesis tyrosine autokinase [Candidatus Sulfotelmatobacter sp.]
MGDGPSSLTWEQAVRVLRKRRKLIGFTVLGMIALAVAAALLMHDVYRPTARLEIDPVGGEINALQEIEGSRSQIDQDYLDTQVQVLQSDGLAMGVIRNLRLDRNAEFVHGSTGAGVPKASQVPGAASHPHSYLQEQLELATTTPDEAKALQVFRSKLSVSPVRGSHLVEVSFASRDPETAQRVVNSLITQFLDRNYRDRYTTTMEASDWLSGQLDELRRKVDHSTKAVAKYQRHHGLVDSDEKEVPSGELLSDVSRQLSDAQADRIQAEASVRMIDAGQGDAIGALRDDVVYQALLTRLADARGQLAQAKTIYGDENTTVKKLNGEVEELAVQVDAERERVVRRVRASFDTAKSRENMMQGERQRLLARMGDVSSHLVEYRMLKNEAMADATLYNTLQARLLEAGIYAGLKSGNIRVIDMAPLLRNPTGPRRGLIIAGGVMLSAFLAVVLAFVSESFDNTVCIPDDISNWLRVPSLAVVPSVMVGQKRETRLPEGAVRFPELEESANSLPKVFWSGTQTAEAEAVRTLRTAVLLPSLGAVPKVILVSSPGSGEGKTTVALNLAGALAQQGSTCLIEADMRRPVLGPALRIETEIGLGEILQGNGEVTKALATVQGIPGLAVLTTKGLPASPADLLASERMRATVRAVRELFQFVIIDSPPILPFSDAQTLASLSDAVILVSRHGTTTRRAIIRAAELLSSTRAHLLGVVLNDMDITSADYHYFNYGYSWALSARQYKRVLPSSEFTKNEREKAKGAHA